MATTRSEMIKAMVFETLKENGNYPRAPRYRQFFGQNCAPIVEGGDVHRQTGLGADIITKLINVAGEAIAIPEGAPTPGQLYAEAAPRVQRILKQYDEASPHIDWVNRNWPTLAITLILGGTVAVVGGNALYDWLKKPRKK